MNVRPKYYFGSKLSFGPNDKLAYDGPLIRLSCMTPFVVIATSTVNSPLVSGGIMLFVETSVLDFDKMIYTTTFHPRSTSNHQPLAPSGGYLFE